MKPLSAALASRFSPTRESESPTRRTSKVCANHISITETQMVSTGASFALMEEKYSLRHSAWNDMSWTPMKHVESKSSIPTSLNWPWNNSTIVSEITGNHQRISTLRPWSKKMMMGKPLKSLSYQLNTMFGKMRSKKDMLQRVWCSVKVMILEKNVTSMKKCSTAVTDLEEWVRMWFQVLMKNTIGKNTNRSWLEVMRIIWRNNEFYLV